MPDYRRGVTGNRSMLASSQLGEERESLAAIHRGQHHRGQAGEQVKPLFIGRRAEIGRQRRCLRFEGRGELGDGDDVHGGRG